jgi:hypothetical protein
MTTISARIIADSPPSIALGSMERYLNAKSRVLDLVVPLKGLGLPTELELERAVTVEFRTQRNKLLIGRDPERIDVAWSPKDGGPYPDFKGSIAIQPASGNTELELHGEYEPPLGFVGAAFDAVLGNRIAQATANALLGTLKAELERDYATVKDTIENAP